MTKEEFARLKRRLDECFEACRMDIRQIEAFTALIVTTGPALGIPPERRDEHLNSMLVAAGIACGRQESVAPWLEVFKEMHRQGGAFRDLARKLMETERVN